MAIGTAVRRPTFPEAITGRAPASVGPLVQSNSFVYRSQIDTGRAFLAKVKPIIESAGFTLRDEIFTGARAAFAD
jgi:hypothetical protein